MSVAPSNALDSLQHNVKHVAEPLIRCNNRQCPTELPKINVVVPRPQISFPVSTMPAFTLTHRGTLPAITSKKCQPQLEKVIMADLHHAVCQPFNVSGFFIAAFWLSDLIWFHATIHAAFPVFTAQGWIMSCSSEDLLHATFGWETWRHLSVRSK